MELEHGVESYASSKSVGIIYDQNRKYVRVWITVLMDSIDGMLVGEVAGETC